MLESISFKTKPIEILKQQRYQADHFDELLPYIACDTVLLGALDYDVLFILN
jgi:hypothetical protein